MNKSAKEMFEELGYIVFEDNEPELNSYCIVITTEECYNSIIFDKNRKRILFDYANIGIEELQAINKMVSELGWKNE